MFDEEEEDHTLSTDTHHDNPQGLLQATASSTRCTAIADKPIPLIKSMASKFDKLVVECSKADDHQLSGDRGAAVKKKLSSHPSLIKKQISLYERDSSFEGATADGPIKPRLRSVEQFEDGRSPQFSHIDAMTSSYGHRAALGMTSVAPPSKTKSCVNLKNYQVPARDTVAATSSHCGALIVKEAFIEPPKRVSKSFHGKTDLLKQNPYINLRFSTTLINEIASKENQKDPI